MRRRRLSPVPVLMTSQHVLPGRIVELEVIKGDRRSPEALRRRQGNVRSSKRKHYALCPPTSTAIWSSARSVGRNRQAVETVDCKFNGGIRIHTLA